MKTPSIIQTKMQLKGRYQIQRIKANSGQIIQSTPWMNNLITNAGKEKYLSSPGSYLYGAVGTGNSTPQVGNTALDNELHRKSAANTNDVSSVFTESGGTLKRIYWFRFNPGEATGNISELGIYLNKYNHTALFSRALVRDSNGNPTTITVLSDEYLDIYWELTLGVAGRSTGTFPLYNKDGSTSMIDWVMKAAAGPHWKLEQPTVHDYGYWTYLANNITDEPSHNDTDPPSLTAWHAPNYGLALPYSDGSYYRDYEYQWSLDRGNISGINCFRLHMGPGHLWLYLPNHSFEKTNMDTLTLRFRLSVV